MMVRHETLWPCRVILPLMILATPIHGQSKPKNEVTAGYNEVSTPKKLTSSRGRPAIITIKELADFETLSPERKRLIETAIKVATDWPWLPYAFGGADPAQGGMDCSGAMYYVMKRAGLVPPRTALAQYLWLNDHQRLHLVAEGADTDKHPSMRWLKPGDLLFWSTDNTIVPGKIANINHVAMYLGSETRDTRKIMINSTDGRSYRGIQSNGYGIYDFKMPTKGSKSKLIGYGTPPGIPETIIAPGAPQIPQSQNTDSATNI